MATALASDTTARSLRGASAGISPSVVLFLAMFASQSGVLVLSPILSDVASDFGVSIAQAGQLRIVAAPLAAVVAIVVARSLARFSPRALLGVGSSLVALGSAASAAAPSYVLLAVAQVPVWAGIATLLAAGVAATAAWSTAETRTRVVAHAFAGPPAAWIVGMPVIGVVASVHWRLAFLALPFPAALLALAAVLRRPSDRPLELAETSMIDLLRRGDVRRWSLGELAANAAWAGTLVYSGALFTERYGMSSVSTGVALALIAVGYLAGNQWAGRAEPGGARRAMLVGSLAAAAAVGLTWMVTPTFCVTLALFAAAAFVAASRTVAGTVYGFQVAGDRGREVGAIRAVTTQAGYLVGSLIGGIALAAGGFPLLGVAFGGLFLASVLPYVAVRGGLGVRALASPQPEPAASAAS